MCSPLDPVGLGRWGRIYRALAPHFSPAEVRGMQVWEVAVLLAPDPDQPATGAHRRGLDAATLEDMRRRRERQQQRQVTGG